MKHAVIAYHIYFEHEYQEEINQAAIEEKREIDKEVRRTDMLAGGIK